MSSTLTVTTSFVTDHWEIVAAISPQGTLPLEIFVYENTGTGDLGPFFGTCSLKELQRLRIFTPGTPIKVFANKFVRYGQAKINVNSEADIAGVIAALVENVKDLSSAYQAQSSTIQTIQIP